MSERVVLVTGALAGISRATATAFAREGAAVVVSGRDEDGKAFAAELRALEAEAEYKKRSSSAGTSATGRARLALFSSWETNGGWPETIRPRCRTYRKGWSSAAKSATGWVRRVGDAEQGHR